MKNNILFFDTETDGLPQAWNLDFNHVDNWPVPVSLGWIVTDNTGNVQKERYEILKRTDVKESDWSLDAQQTHGISWKQNQTDGISLLKVYAEFISDLSLCEKFVCHNTQFDLNIIRADLIRVYENPIWPDGLSSDCTMLSSTDYCELPNRNNRMPGYKWPKLEELYFILFGKKMEGAHHALNDVRAAKDCFFELQKRKVIC